MDLSVAEEAVGASLGLEPCYRDPEVAVFGLHNVLFAVGDQFLEVVAPRPGNNDTSAGRLLSKRGGDAGYMVILQTDDQAAVAERATSLGLRVVFEAEGGDASAGTQTRGLHFHPKDVGGAILSVDQSENPAEWAWAGPAWRDHVRTGVVEALTGVTIEVDDPVATARTWAALLGCESDESNRITLDDSELSFVQGDRGVVGLEMAAGSVASDRKFDLLGTTVTVEAE